MSQSQTLNSILPSGFPIFPNPSPAFANEMTEFSSNWENFRTKDALRSLTQLRTSESGHVVHVSVFFILPRFFVFLFFILSHTFFYTALVVHRLNWNTFEKLKLGIWVEVSSHSPRLVSLLGSFFKKTKSRWSNDHVVYGSGQCFHILENVTILKKFFQAWNWFSLCFD